MKSLLVRVIVAIVLLEAGYLALANLALNLPLTQTLINEHRSEKYAVYWDRAWTWYPLRVHASGVSANGQTGSQQWQADASGASASLSLLPLLGKTVKLSGVEARDVSFRLRPRPKPDNDYAAIRDFFPPIRDRDPDAPAAVRQSGKDGRGHGEGGRGWRIEADGIHATGSHRFWIRQVRGAVDGELSAGVSFETRGGPFALDGGAADVALRSLNLNRDWEVSNEGSLKGRFTLAPFIPSEHSGLNALGFLSLDAELDAVVDSLGFLDFYLGRFNGMALDGKGRLSGELHFDQGDLAPGTDLAVSADQLDLSADPYAVRGVGRVGIKVPQEEGGTLHIQVLFSEMEGFHQGDEVPLFSGERLEVAARGTARMLPDAEREGGDGGVVVSIPSVRVPDLRVYQRYVPDRWGLRILAGSGELKGRTEFSTAALSTDLVLVSKDADLALKDYRFEADLDLGLKVVGGASDAAQVDLAGTYLRLDDARLVSGHRGDSRPWQAAFSIARGTLAIPVPGGGDAESGFIGFADALKQQDLKTVLASADADLTATLGVSDLGWVDLLFNNPFGLTVSGAGEIAADLRIRSGWLARDTMLKVAPKGLRVQVLDYEARGAGDVTLAVVRGGETPAVRLDARLGGANLRRLGEREAVVEQVDMEVSALATGVTLGGGTVAKLGLRIPSAKVTDMRVYNEYLPEGSPLELLAGQAELTADIRLEPESADGFVKLVTDQLRTRLDEQEVSGRLTLDIRLTDGVPKDMDFDISGSKLLLDGFRVSGEQQGFDQPDWQARFDLHKARVLWRKPIRLDLQAGIRMNDSRPIVSMFANQRGKHGWLEKILTVEDIQGEARMEIADNRVLVPYAMAGSDKIDVGAKGIVDADDREGIFYARFRKLKGILKVRNGERNFDILSAKKTFDAYAPGEAPLDLGPSGTAASADHVSDPDASGPGSKGGKPDARGRTAPAEKKDDEEPAISVLGESL